MSADRLVEGGFANKRGSFLNGSGFDKLNLTAFIRIALMSNWYYTALTKPQNLLT